MLINPKCYYCKNHLEKESIAFKKLVCKAFPEGVPSEIQSTKIQHNKPYPGDNGIMFEPNEIWKKRMMEQ